MYTSSQKEELGLTKDTGMNLLRCWFLLELWSWGELLVKCWVFSYFFFAHGPFSPML